MPLKVRTPSFGVTVDSMMPLAIFTLSPAKAVVATHAHRSSAEMKVVKGFTVHALYRQSRRGTRLGKSAHPLTSRYVSFWRAFSRICNREVRPQRSKRFPPLSEQTGRILLY